MKKTPEPRSLMDVVKQHFHEFNVTYTQEADNRLLAIMDVGKLAASFHVETSEEHSLVAVYGHFGSHVPVDRRVPVAELLTRINYQVYSGCFALDFSDGEIVFRHCIDVEGGQLVPLMVQSMVMLARGMMDKYHDTIMSVAFGFADPRHALASE